MIYFYSPEYPGFPTWENVDLDLEMPLVSRENLTNAESRA